MKCLQRLLFFLFLGFVFISCGSLKKSKTITETVTITRIDTIIQVVRDTFTVVKTVTITDTAIVENTLSRAVSFINPVTGKLTLQLTGKIFDLPVKAEIIQTRKTESRDNERKPFFSNYFLAFILGVIFVALIVFYAFIKFKLKL
jgi:hypothetical protein